MATHTVPSPKIAITLTLSQRKNRRIQSKGEHHPFLLSLLPNSRLSKKKKFAKNAQRHTQQETEPKEKNKHTTSHV